MQRMAGKRVATAAFSGSALGRLWAGINGSRTLSSETSLEPFAQQPVAPEGFVLQNSLIELDG